jgi:hypothetical protein
MARYGFRPPVCWRVLVALGVAACADGGKEVASPASVLDLLEDLRVIPLEESDSVLNVRYTLRRDPLGGFLIADEAENRIRGYDAEGAFRFQAGGPGDGPGEYRQAIVALRAPDGRIWTFDARGKAVILGPDGAFEREFRLPLLVIHDARVLDDSTAVVGGRFTDLEDGARIHLVNVSSGVIERSFFVPAVSPELVATANSAGLVHVAVAPGGIHATFGIQDTVFTFDVNGRPLQRTPIPAGEIRPPRPVTREISRSATAMREWMDSFTLFSGVFPLEDGSFVVQYQDRKNMLPQWRMVHFDSLGLVRFEMRDTPYLLDAETDSTGRLRLLMVDPDALEENRLLYGSVKR